MYTTQYLCMGVCCGVLERREVEALLWVIDAVLVEEEKLGGEEK